MATPSAHTVKTLIPPPPEIPDISLLGTPSSAQRSATLVRLARAIAELEARVQRMAAQPLLVGLERAPGPEEVTSKFERPEPPPSGLDWEFGLDPASEPQTPSLSDLPQTFPEQSSGADTKWQVAPARPSRLGDPALRETTLHSEPQPLPAYSPSVAQVEVLSRSSRPPDMEAQARVSDSTAPTARSQRPPAGQSERRPHFRWLTAALAGVGGALIIMALFGTEGPEPTLPAASAPTEPGARGEAPLKFGSARVSPRARHVTEAKPSSPGEPRSGAGSSATIEGPTERLVQARGAADPGEHSVTKPVPDRGPAAAAQAEFAGALPQAGSKPRPASSSGTPTARAVAAQAPAAPQTEGQGDSPQPSPEVAAPGRSEPELPAAPNATLVAQALAGAAERAGACAEPGGPSGIANVRILLNPAGGVLRATVTGAQFAGTSVGACLERAFQGASTPAFAGRALSTAYSVFIAGR